MAFLRRLGHHNFKIILIILALVLLWFYWLRSPPNKPANFAKLNQNKLMSQSQREENTNLKNQGQREVHNLRDMFTIENCQCARSKKDIAKLRNIPRNFFDSKSESTCSDLATLRGPGQKVVSYSYYLIDGLCETSRDRHFEVFLGQLHGTITSMKKYYPGWVVRIYHNVTVHDAMSSDELCRIYCDHDNVDLCHVYDLPVLGNLADKGVVGRFWRFSVMGDPTVEVFMSRDTDSWVLEREAMAVKEWLSSGVTYHLMHDHPKHRPVIMSGLWGAFNKDQEYLQQVRDFMFEWRVSDKPSHDNEMLRILVWPIMKDDVLNHDSFTCNDPNHGPNVPFPTQREGNKYCGWGLSKTDPALDVEETECPVECRPDDHKDWISC